MTEHGTKIIPRVELLDELGNKMAEAQSSGFYIEPGLGFANDSQVEISAPGEDMLKFPEVVDLGAPDAFDFDLSEIVHGLKVEIAFSGQEMVEAAEPMVLTAQRVSRDEWGGFLIEMHEKVPATDNMEVTVLYERPQAPPLYDAVYVPVHEAHAAGPLGVLSIEQEDFEPRVREEATRD